MCEHGFADSDISLLNDISRLTPSDRRRVILLIALLTDTLKFADPGDMYPEEG